jgi:ATP-dependent protease ClpP protease subunit
MKTAARIGVALLASLALGATSPRDPANPTCPLNPGWSMKPKMEFSIRTVDGLKVMVAEGRIDAGVVQRLQAMLAKHPDLDEIWFSSPGGDARAGNAAGRLIRDTMDVTTRIPAGWACYSACNFMFMGGRARMMEPGGEFIVHMFTRTGDRDAIDSSVAMGTEATTELIGEIEQDAAQLASEDNDFLIRMFLSRELLTDIMYKQKAVKGSGADKSTRRCLTQDEASKYGVVNATFE